MNYSLSVILPVINESQSLEKTLLSIESLSGNDVLEYLIVTCSKTTEEAFAMTRSLVERYPGRVNEYRQIEPGIGAAMREAFMQVHGTHLVMMSSDLETDPEALPKLIAESKQYPESVVASSRWLKGGGFKDYGFFKWMFNRGFRKIVQLLFTSDLTDFTYGYRIYPLHIVQNTLWTQNDHSFFLETLLRPLKAGVRIREVPVLWIPREEGESNIRFSSYYNYLNTAFRLRFGRLNKR